MERMNYKEELDNLCRGWVSHTKKLGGCPAFARRTVCISGERTCLMWTFPACGSFAGLLSMESCRSNSDEILLHTT